MKILSEKDQLRQTLNNIDVALSEENSELVKLKYRLASKVIYGAWKFWDRKSAYDLLNKVNRQKDVIKYLEEYRQLISKKLLK